MSKKPSSHKPPTLTTAAGNPVVDNQNSLTAGPRGPVLLGDFHLLEKMAHFNRERIPERVVHAKGSGAYDRMIALAEQCMADYDEDGWTGDTWL